MRQTIHSDAAPEAIGPYSQAVEIDGLVFCSGQIPLDPRSMEIVAGGIEAQTRQVLDNLGAVLRAAGCGFDDVVRTTIYLTDLGAFGTVNAIYAERFGATKPARATVQVSALPKGAQVEIDCIAQKPA